MTAGRRVWLASAIVGATLSFAAAAAAQEPGPPADPEAAPYDDEQQPPGATPPGGQPPEPGAPLAPAPATPAPVSTDDTGFGFAGQITISDDLQLIALQQSTTQPVSGQSTKFTDVELRPAVDYFPIPNLSVGGQLIISYMSVDSGGSSRTGLGVHARVGYSFPFSPTTSIWPRVGIGYDHFSGALGGNPADNSEFVPFEIFVPFVFQPASHFFIGLGPIIRTDLVASQNGSDAAKTTTIGLQSTLGGCFHAM